jgi:hypothetical protein
MKLMNNLVFHAQRKRIEVQHHCIKKKVHAREIEIIYTPTTQQQVDVFKSHWELSSLKSYKLT